MRKHTKVMDRIIEMKVRIDAGNGLIYWMKNLIIIAAAIKYMFTLNNTETVFVGIGGIIALYVLGCLDVDIFHFTQRNNKITTEKYNPYFKDLKNSVNRKTKKI